MLIGQKSDLLGRRQLLGKAARKASFPPRFAITSTCWHNPSIARIPIRE